MTPWAVRPSAGWPNSAARAAKASILQAPSRSEYSEWTCKWTAGDGTKLILGRGSDAPERRSAQSARCLAALAIRVHRMLRQGGIPRFAHAVIEYVAGAFLIVAPFLFNYDKRTAVSIVAGVGLIF